YRRCGRILSRSWCRPVRLSPCPYHLEVLLSELLGPIARVTGRRFRVPGTRGSNGHFRGQTGPTLAKQDRVVKVSARARALLFSVRGIANEDGSGRTGHPRWSASYPRKRRCLANSGNPCTVYTLLGVAWRTSARSS